MERHRRLRNSNSFQALKMSFASPDFVNGMRDQQELANHVEKQQKRTRQEFEEKKAKAARTFAYGNAK